MPLRQATFASKRGGSTSTASIPDANAEAARLEKEKQAAAAAAEKQRVHQDFMNSDEGKASSYLKGVEKDLRTLITTIGELDDSGLPNAVADEQKATLANHKQILDDVKVQLLAISQGKKENVQMLGAVATKAAAAQTAVKAWRKLKKIKFEITS